jgi:hypothetical protein
VFIKKQVNIVLQERQWMNYQSFLSVSKQTFHTSVGKKAQSKITVVRKVNTVIILSCFYSSNRSDRTSCSYQRKRHKKM